MVRLTYAQIAFEMRNKICSIFFMCLFFWGYAQAQNLHKIQGKIRVNDLKNHQQALVSLYLDDAQTLIKIEVPNADGTFEFVQIPSRNYKLSIDFPGYQTYWSEVFQLNQTDLTLPEIVLSSLATQQLSEVVITKKKALIENKIDRTVVNVDAMMITAGGDAMDVLEKSPGIIVDQNGTITFKGKSGVQVFIDDKPTYLSGSELEAYLKSLPASTLDKIELMTNPPAKYDAAGSAGVINIVSKRSKNRGFNGSVTSRYSQGKRPMTRQGINLNYASEKVRIFGNIGYAYMNPVNDLFIFRRFKNPDGTAKSLFYQDSYLNNKTQTANARVGIDYFLSKKTTLGIGVSGLLKSNRQKNQVNSKLTNPSGIVDSTIVANNTEKERFGNLGLNLNFRHDIDSLGQKITADFDYLNYDTSNNQTFKNFIYQPNGLLSSQDELRGDLPTQIGIYSFKTDYAKPLKNNGSFEAGYKVSFSKTDNQADYRDVVSGTEVPNYDTSNHFKYDEMIHAAYINYNTTYKRFTFQTGLRLEHTSSKGNQLGNILKPASTFKRNYTNLFPTVYVQYQLDSIGNHLLSVNYGRRINRPYFQDLNPFVSPLDKFTFYAGNPYLNPSFAHNYELSYRYKEILSTTLSYGDLRDEVNETIEIKDEIYYSRPGNIGKSEYYSWNVNLNLSPLKWWTTSVYNEVTYTKYQSKLYTETLNSSGTFWFLMVNNNFKLGKDWSAELNGNYQTDIVSAQFVLLSRSNLSVGIQKKILQGKGSLKLTGNDLLYSNLNNGIIKNIQNTDANWRNRADTRFIALTFTYGFGKALHNKQAYEANGADSEKNRVKN